MREHRDAPPDGMRALRSRLYRESLAEARRCAEEFERSAREFERRASMGPDAVEELFTRVRDTLEPRERRY